MKRMERDLNNLGSKSLYHRKKNTDSFISTLPKYTGPFPGTTSPIPPPSLPPNQNNNNNNRKSVNLSMNLRQPPYQTGTTTATSSVLGTSGSQPSPSSPQGTKAVFVNLNLTGSIVEDKRRLSKLLQQVNDMRVLRERHEKYGSEESLDADIEADIEEKDLQRSDQIIRSRQLMFKYRVYDFLKRPSTVWATAYHIVAFVLVAACLVVSVFPDIERYFGKLPVLETLEKLVLFSFSAEFLLRLWSSECRPLYRGWRGKVEFMKSPAHLIDLLVIILSAVLSSLSIHEGHEVFAFRAFRGFHRFFQILQVVTLKRQLRPWRLFTSVLYDQREQLLIIFYLEIVLLCGLSYLCFLVEHEDNPQLANIADAMWWGVVTLTTTGYGDKVPTTYMGKFLSAIFIMFGVAVFALPAGIIGAGLALKLEEVERNRQRRKKKDAAAILIQKGWKCYRANFIYQELSKFVRHHPGDRYHDKMFEQLTVSFFAIVAFHRAKTVFKELTRPIDLKNVIESYKYGQMDIFSRLKHLNSALDIIISRMSLAESERLTAINRLSKQLDQIEMNGGLVIRGGGEGVGRTGSTLYDDGKNYDTGSRIVDSIRTKSGTYLMADTIGSNESVPTVSQLFDYSKISKRNNRSMTSLRNYRLSLQPHYNQLSTNYFSYSGVGSNRQSAPPIPRIDEVNYTDEEAEEEEQDDDNGDDTNSGYEEYDILNGDNEKNPNQFQWIKRDSMDKSRRSIVESDASITTASMEKINLRRKSGRNHSRPVIRRQPKIKTRQRRHSE